MPSTWSIVSTTLSQMHWSQALESYVEHANYQRQSCMLCSTATPGNSANLGFQPSGGSRGLTTNKSSSIPPPCDSSLSMDVQYESTSPPNVLLVHPQAELPVWKFNSLLRVTCLLFLLRISFGKSPAAPLPKDMCGLDDSCNHQDGLLGYCLVLW